MSRFILVHGAGQNSTVWGRVAKSLRDTGQTVDTPDLPGHGVPRQSVKSVTFRAYVDCICQAIDASPEPVILVGHSMGGAVVTQAAEERWRKIKQLVYVAGLIPRCGETVNQVLERDQWAELHKLSQPSASGETLKADLALMDDIIYNGCKPEEIAQAKSQLCLQALVPFEEPIFTTPERWGRVPKAYITCLLDRAVSPAFQSTLYTENRCEPVIPMDTGHAPFLAAPLELAGHLMRLST